MCRRTISIYDDDDDDNDNDDNYIVKVKGLAVIE